MMRRLWLMVCGALLAVGLFSSAQFVQAQENMKEKARRRVPNASITLGMWGSQMHHLGVVIIEGRKVLFSETIDASIDALWQWSDGYNGHRYHVVVMDTTGNIIVTKYVRLSKKTPTLVMVPEAPADPRDQQIQALQSQVADLDYKARLLTSYDLRVFANANMPQTVTYVKGALDARQADWTIQPASGQRLAVSVLTLRKNFAPGLQVQNLRVWVGGTQFGPTRATVGDSDLMDFSPVLEISGVPVPHTISSGFPEAVSAYGGILSTSTVGTYSAAYTLVSWLAIDMATGSAVPFPSEVPGQNVRVTDGPVLSVATSSYGPVTRTATMGTSGGLLSIRTSADSTDDIATWALVVDVDIENYQFGKPGFTGFELRDGPKVLATAGMIVMQSATTGTVTFQLSEPMVTLKNGNMNPWVYGDVAAYSSGDAASGTKYAFSAKASGITATSVGSPSATVTVVGSAQGDPVTLSRSLLSVTTSGSATGSVRNPSSTDDLFTVNYFASAFGSLRVDGVPFLLQGGAAPSSLSAFTVSQIDTATGTTLGSSSLTTPTWDSAMNGWVVTLYPQYTLSEGSVKSAHFRVDTSGFVTGGLSVTILDVQWSDGSSTFGLNPSVLPILGINTTYQK